MRMQALELLRHMGIRITEFGDDLHQCSICNLDFNNVNGEHLRCQKCSDKLRQCKNCSKKVVVGADHIDCIVKAAH